MFSIVTTCESKRDGAANAKDYSRMASRLVNSIRKNGGLFKDVPIYMWFASDHAPHTDVQDSLKSLGCILVPGANGSDPLFSKVQAVYDCSCLMGTERLLWLDSDMLILNPMDRLVDFMGVDVAATSTEKIHHRYARPEDTSVIKDLCEGVGVNFQDYDKLRIITMMDKQVGNFNFNSGIMLLNRNSGIISSYLNMAAKILSKAKENPNVTDYCFDATSVALSVVDLNLSWGKLPMTFNHYYALHQCVYPDTVIVHYQDNDLNDLFPSLWNSQ